ncbi:hypothetical protein AMTRI_Chr03g144520 [Amborella trichopoda]
MLLAFPSLSLSLPNNCSLWVHVYCSLLSHCRVTRFVLSLLCSFLKNAETLVSLGARLCVVIQKKI